MQRTGWRPPPGEGLSIIGKALGAMGVGVFVAAFLIELTDVIERRRYRRAKQARQQTTAARQGATAQTPTPEGSDGGDGTGHDRTV